MVSSIAVEIRVWGDADGTQENVSKQPVKLAKVIKVGFEGMEERIEGLGKDVVEEELLGRRLRAMFRRASHVLLETCRSR